MSIEIIESDSVLPGIISPGSIVVNCGANVGHFSLEMIKTFWLYMLLTPDTFSRIPEAGSSHRYNFALCATTTRAELVFALQTD
jgi:hypothetical protein